MKKVPKNGRGNALTLRATGYHEDFSLAMHPREKLEGQMLAARAQNVEWAVEQFREYLEELRAAPGEFHKGIMLGDERFIMCSYIPENKKDNA